jgi:hypothetical protein
LRRVQRSDFERFVSSQNLTTGEIEMGLIVNKKGGIQTVGELVMALAKFPADMPVKTGCDSVLKVYKVKPQSGEVVDDKRGAVYVEGDFDC